MFVASEFNPVELGSYRSSNSNTCNQKTNAGKGLKVRTKGLPEDLKLTQSKEEFETKAVAFSAEAEQGGHPLRTCYNANYRG